VEDQKDAGYWEGRCTKALVGWKRAIQEQGAYKAEGNESREWDDGSSGTQGAARH